MTRLTALGENKIRVEHTPTKKIGAETASLLVILFSAMLLVSALFCAYSWFFPGDPLLSGTGMVIGFMGWLSATLLLFYVWRRL